MNAGYESDIAFMWGDSGVNTQQFHGILGVKAVPPNGDPLWAHKEVITWLDQGPHCVSKGLDQFLDMQSLFAVRAVGKNATMQVVAHVGFTSLTGEHEVGELRNGVSAVWELVSVVSNPGLRKQGFGFGRAAVFEATQYFSENRAGDTVLEEILCLTCDENLIDFYTKLGFGFPYFAPEIVRFKQIVANENNKHVMTYNK